jgi:hypothetical protein
LARISTSRPSPARCPRSYRLAPRMRPHGFRSLARFLWHFIVRSLESQVTETELSQGALQGFYGPLLLKLSTSCPDSRVSSTLPGHGLVRRMCKCLLQLRLSSRSRRIPCHVRCMCNVWHHSPASARLPSSLMSLNSTISLQQTSSSGPTSSSLRSQSSMSRSCSKRCVERCFSVTRFFDLLLIRLV